ncbi:hypothetical protein PSTT_10199, partial [Puccinia striiformis]
CLHFQVRSLWLHRAAPLVQAVKPLIEISNFEWDLLPKVDQTSKLFFSIQLPASNLEYSPRLGCIFRYNTQMGMQALWWTTKMSTEYHSKLPLHISKLPANLPSNYRESTVEEGTRETCDQILPGTFDLNEDHKSVNENEADALRMGSERDEYDAAACLLIAASRLVDVGMEDDSSVDRIEDSESESEPIVMREVLDIFQPCDQSDSEDGDEREGAGEDDPGPEAEADEFSDRGWFPFTGTIVSHKLPPVWCTCGGLEQMVAILMTGYMHNIMSRTQYDKVRTLLELLGTKLHHWTSVWRAKAKLRAMLNMEPNRRDSVFNNKCYSISMKKSIALDMANPYVNPYLDYYPVDSGGINVYKLSQSRKWRECLPREYRAQMVAVKNKHYYIYEPCQLESGSLVIPIFFYEHLGKIHAKCVKPHTHGAPNDADFKIIIPQHLPYNSSKLISIDCEEFALAYSEICLWAGRPLESDVVDYRDWKETIDRTHQLWDTAINGTKDDYIIDSKAYGVQDAINKEFIDMLKDRKQKHEVGKIMAIAKHEYDKLFNPFLRLL